MKAKEGRVQGAAVATDDFLTRRAADLPKTTATAVRKELADQLTQLRANADTQSTEALRLQNATQLKVAMRDDLFRKQLGPIISMANVRLRKEADFTPIVRPKADLAVAKLVPAITAIANTLQPFAQTLIDGGLDADFLDKLQSSAESVAMASKARASRKGGRVNATSAIGVSARAIMATINTLDSMITAELDDNPAVLAEWRALKRFTMPVSTKTPTTPAKPATPATPATPVTPVTPATTATPHPEAPTTTS